jgi:hypothetical protein
MLNIIMAMLNVIMLNVLGPSIPSYSSNWANLIELLRNNLVRLPRLNIHKQEFAQLLMRIGLTLNIR